MSQDRPSIDVLRERWRHAKCLLHLEDVNSADFGSGGLGSRLDDPSVRLLVLPADPEDVLIEFDEEVHEWWKQDWTDPATGEQASWGPTTVTAEAIVRYDANSQDSWTRYLALRRDGGIDLGLGSDCAGGGTEERHFWLVTIVGRIWAALSVYPHVLERLSVPGPWQITLAMMRTEGAHLAGVADGWADPFHGGYHLKPSKEPALLHSRVVWEWPDEAGCQELAFQLGAVIDNTWGVFQRRFLVQTGESTGDFDAAKCRWW